MNFVVFVNYFSLFALMRFSLAICLSVLIFFGEAFGQSSDRAVESGKVYVKLKGDAVPVFESRLRSMKRASSDTSAVKIGLKSFDGISRKYRANNIKRVFPDAGKYEAKHRKYGLHLWYEITIPENEDPETVVKAYGSDENVLISEPEYKKRRLAGRALAAPSSQTPDDPYFDRQWNFNNTGQTGGTPGADIHLMEAWEKVAALGIKNQNVIVAVTDEGVYYDHEDLKANMWVNEVELNGTNGVDDDGNGYVDDIYGYNFVPNGRGQMVGSIQPGYHGTHVAGIVAAVTNNGKGVSGISGGSKGGYGIKIMTVQIMNDTRSDADVVKAFTYAADNGAVISQNSWGYDNPNYYNRKDIEAINYFINEAGRDENSDPRPGTPMVGGIVIFAASNDGQDAKWYPAYFDNVLAVAAVDHNGRLAPYSNYGNWIDISAPGGYIKDIRDKEEIKEGIYSTSYTSLIKNYYEYLDGTSMACPHVSGVAALILSVYGSKDFTPDMLRNRLLATATPAADYDSEHAAVMGAGLLNAAEALVPQGIPDKITDLGISEIKNASVKLTWTVPPVAGGGKVIGFVVARSTEEITEDNFDSYAENLVRSSVASGEEQIYTLTGLVPATGWNVAVRCVGNLGDKSEISNVVGFITDINHAPEVHGLLSDTTLIPYTTPAVIDLSKYVIDPDGDVLHYDYTLSRSDIVDAVIAGNTLIIDPRHYGFVALKLTAVDPFSEKVTASIDITVEQKYSSDEPDDLLVYPNPTNGVLHYSFVLNEAASVMVRAVNTAGAVMYQIPSVSLPAGAHYYEIDLSEWAPGMYMLQYLKNGKTTDVKKFVKQ